MSVLVELTYEMSKALGEVRIEVDAVDVAAAIDETRKRFEKRDEDFETLRARTAIAVNGTLVRYRDESGAALRPGDRVSFVKAAAGG